MNQIHIDAPKGTSGSEARLVRTCVRRALRFLRLSGVSIAVHLVDDREMRTLNFKFRGRAAATTILSFEAGPEFPGPRGRARELGEIYLAPGRIRKERADIEHLIIHGILHLMGYSHDTKRDTIKMERKEDEFLKKMSNS